MITHLQYLKKEATFTEYYSQFATPALVERLRRDGTLDVALKCEDERLNCATVHQKLYRALWGMTKNFSRINDDKVLATKFNTDYFDIVKLNKAKHPDKAEDSPLVFSVSDVFLTGKAVLYALMEEVKQPPTEPKEQL